MVVYLGRQMLDNAASVELLHKRSTWTTNRCCKGSSFQKYLVPEC
jgi:hypothetical protein